MFKLSRRTYLIARRDYLTSVRSKTFLFGLVIFPVLLFAAGMSARANDKSDRARIAQTSATTSRAVDMPPAKVGRIEIPALGLATRVLEGDDASSK